VVFLFAIRDSSSTASLLTGAGEVLHALPDARDTLPSALPDVVNALPGALPKPFHTPLCARAEALDALLCAPADAGDPSAGPLTDVFNCAACSPADAPDHLAGVGEQVMSSAAHVTKRLANALEQLGVAVQCCQDARQDLRDFRQADLEQCLRLYILDVELDLPEPHRGAGIQLYEMPGLGEQGEVGPEVVHLELDLIDLDDRRVNEDVNRLLDLLRIDY
jgi:hypothetical protein